MTRRLLIVAAEFPPVKGIGRLRPLKFCQHLQGFGWQTAVLAPEVGAIEPIDLETLKEVPEHTHVFRAPLPRPKERLIRSIKAILNGPDGGRDLTSANSGATAPCEAVGARSPGATRQWSAGDLLGWFDGFVRRNIMIPDDIALWHGPAVREGLSVIHAFKPDVILATAPHFTNLRIGATLARKSGLPWIADYRDLWTGDVLRSWVPGWRQRVELAIERRLLATASAVVAVSEPKSVVLRTRLREGAACPVVTLTNGYDPEEFESVQPELGAPDIFRIVYAGRLFKNRRGYELIEAAGNLLRSRPELVSRLRIEYYGGVAPEIAERMRELISRFSLTDVVRFHPDVPYERSKALQMGADALLLIVDSGETTSGVIPGKLFEYIAAGRPLLCISAPGATPDIITRGKLGHVVSPGDVEGLTRVLEILLGPGDGRFAPDHAYLDQFERAKIVERLASLLEKVIGNAEIMRKR